MADVTGPPIRRTNRLGLDRVYFAAALVTALALGHTTAWAQCYVLFTVDVETRSFGTPDSDIWGILPGEAERHGIERMMDILDRHGAKGTFFVNVYEAPRWQEGAIAKVCQAIHARGHDVELHTHPAPMFGVYCMRSTDLQTQTEILKRGTQLVKEWIGTEVTAHRAGGFLANRDTIVACRTVGIPVDSSFVKVDDSHPLVPGDVTVNACVAVDGVLELPATSYVQAGLGNYQSMRYLDIESSSPDEIRQVVADLQRHDVRTAVIMLHSFSFSRFGRPNERVERALDGLLAGFKADPNVSVVTARQLHDIWQTNPDALKGSDYLPTTGWWMTYCRAWQRLDEGWKNVVVAFGPIVGFAAAGLVSGIWWFRRRRHRSRAAV